MTATKRELDRACSVLLIDKPAGPTSHELVDWARWSIRARSVGHCGTLDPAATGLLVLCLGAATKLVPYLTAVAKTYRARFVVGAATTTADADGDETQCVHVSPDRVQEIETALGGMVGALRLRPPAFSAVRVGGRRAHELAREGERVILAHRSMTVHELADVRVAAADGRVTVDATVEVSKGSYIRSLAVELGTRCDLPCHLGRLERISCGEISLADSAVLGGLVASELTTLPGRPPKWRIRRSDALDRESCDRLIARYSVPASTCLPFPVLDLARDERLLGTPSDVLERISRGQRLDWDGDDLCTLRDVLPRDCARFAVQGRLADDGVLSIVQILDDGQGRGILAPERVLRTGLGA
ncbi:MAG: tRNA pseudouridine(55) synthase TruB [Nannocystaceae bacterium]